MNIKILVAAIFLVAPGCAYSQIDPVEVKWGHEPHGDLYVATMNWTSEGIEYEYLIQWSFDGKEWFNLGWVNPRWAGSPITLRLVIGVYWGSRKFITQPNRLYRVVSSINPEFIIE